MSFTTPDFTAPAKANLDAVLRAANVASDSAAKLYELNTKTARALFDEVTSQFQAIASIKDPAELTTLASKVTKPDVEKSQAYARTVYDQLVATQSEIVSIVEGQVTEFNKQIVVALDSALKSAPAGSEGFVSAFKSAIATANQAYESATHSWRDLGNTFQSTVAAAAPTTGSKRKTA